MDPNTEAPKRAAIYARISRADNKAPKIKNQIARCRALADQHGYVIPDDTFIYADEGIAASGRLIDDTTLGNRPAATRLVEDLRNGRIDVLLAVEGERLARTYGDGFAFIAASVQGGVLWHLDTDGLIDPATDTGEDQAVSIFGSGRREGRRRDARQTRRYNEERAAGRPLWGTRPFGYKKDRVSLRRREASLIEAAVDDYLAHRRSMVRIAKDWNASGVKTDGMERPRKGRDGVSRPARGIWTATTVRQLLLRPRNAGIYLHNGEELPNSQIKPIITRPQHEALKARVKSGTPLSERAQTLLGGILRCECGAPMHGTVSYSQRKDGPRHEYQHYKCSQSLYDKSRRHASIVQSTADELLATWLWLDLFRGDLASSGDDVSSALDAVTTRLADNADSVLHVSVVLLDKSLKSVHGSARTDLRRLDSEREVLEAERDVLAARAAQGGALAAFVKEWQADTSDFASEEERVQWQARFEMVWAEIPLVRKQAMIRARYRPSVKVGGRGANRISPNPVDPSTFGRRIELEPDDD